MRRVLSGVVLFQLAVVGCLMPAAAPWVEWTLLGLLVWTGADLAVRVASWRRSVRLEGARREHGLSMSATLRARVQSLNTQRPVSGARVQAVRSRLAPGHRRPPIP